MKRTSLPVFCLLLLLCAADADADLTSYNLSFIAPDQSLWGGGASAGFQSQGSTPGPVGISWDVGANTGTASGRFDGSLSINHVSSMAAPGITPVTLGFAGTNGLLKSDLGAWLNLGWFVHVGMPWPIPDINLGGGIYSKDYGLNVNQSFLPVIGGTASGQDSFSAFNLEAGIGIVGVGLSFDVIETNRLRVDDIAGKLKYQLAGDTEFESADFTLGPSGALTVNADLDSPGTWNFSLLDLTLDNEFATAFGLGLRPYIDYYFGDWSPGSLSFNLFNVRPFELDFGELSSPTLFSIVVGAAPVPEPGTLLLLGAGLIGLARAGRSRS